MREGAAVEVLVGIGMTIVGTVFLTGSIKLVIGLVMSLAKSQ